MCCCNSCREEFRVKNLLLDHSDARLFVTSQCFPNSFYLVWVTFWAVHHTAVIGLQPYFDYERKPDKFPPDPKWPVYLTNWGITFLFVFSVYDCIVTWYMHKRKKNLLTENNSLPWYLKVQWALFNLATTMAVSVTILYFVLLTPVYNLDSILTHVTTSVFAVSNLIISAKPIRIFHVYHVMIVAATYSVLTMVYQRTSGDLVYNMVDWDNIRFTIYIILGLVFVFSPLVHLICFMIYALRVLIFSKCCIKSKTPNLNYIA